MKMTRAYSLSHLAFLAAGVFMLVAVLSYRITGEEQTWFSVWIVAKLFFAIGIVLLISRR